MSETGTERTITLDTEKYNDFIRCISNLRGVCNDLDIQGGLVRQRTDDNTSIFEFDMTPIISDVNIALTNLKEKIEILKTFQGQEVTLDINESAFTFSDQFTSIRFNQPSMEFMENRFMSEDDLESIFGSSEEDLILRTELQSLITERIKSITQIFNVFSIRVKFEGETASINSATAAKDQSAKFIRNIEMNQVLSECSSNLSTIPFGIDHDTDLEFKMYKDPNQNVALNRFVTTLGEIDITVYSRSSIVED